MRTSVTIKQIAEAAGVSIATVSRSLNDQPGVARDIRERVILTAQRLGYTPNINARRLATSVTQTVAFVFHKDKNNTREDPFYPIIMAGAEASLAAQDYHILLASLDDHSLARPQELSLLKPGLIDGIILAGPEIPPSFILPLLSSGIPLVLVDNCLNRTPTNCVLNDDEGGAYAAAQHLVEHGHNRIAFLSGPESWVSNRERRLGYVRALEQAGIEPRVVSAAETTIRSGESLIQEALERWPDLTAICAVNDSVAIGAIRAAAAAGRKTPGDLAVIGFDDISWASHNQPALSTVHVFKRRIGQLAASLLLDRIRDTQAPPTKSIVATNLVLRESCGHPS